MHVHIYTLDAKQQPNQLMLNYILLYGGLLYIMLKIFTIMYIVSSLYSTAPSLPDDQLIQEITAANISESYEDYLQDSEFLKSLKEVAPPQKIVNYVPILQKMGYYKKEHRDEGVNIRNAVIRFESDNNLVISGVWSETLNKLLAFRLIDENFEYPDLIKRPAADGQWIAVNKSKRILTLYNNTTVVKKFPIAVGNPISLTPSGQFSIVNKIKNPMWGGGGYAKPISGGSPSNPLGKRWMGLSLKGGGSYGIHGNSSPYSIGKVISHGCIRMINSDSEELFDMVGNNIPVWIGNDAELANWGVYQKTVSYLE